MPKTIWEFGTLKLTGDPSKDGQQIAIRYSEGWILIQVVTFFPGAHVAMFHREVDELIDFEQKGAHSQLKAAAPLKWESPIAPMVAEQAVKTKRIGERAKHSGAPEEYIKLTPLEQ